MSKRMPVIGLKISKHDILSLIHQMMSRQLALTLVVSLLLTFLPRYVYCEDATVPHKKILFIYSNSPDFPVYPLLTTGFTEQIKNLGKVQPEYFFEYLEWNRWSTDQKYLDEVTNFWRRKYREKKIDLIVLFGDPAAYFMRARADKIFPGLPVIFTGNALLGYKKSDFPATFVSLLATVDLKLSIEVILRVQPATCKVYLVLGDSEVERRRARDVEEQLKVFAGRVDFIFLNKLPFAKLLESIRTIGGDSVILFMNYLQDVEGNTYIPVQFLKTLHREAHVPIYGTSDTFIGSGAIGGHMTSSAAVGRRAATLGTEILLTGKLPDSRLETSSGSEYIFNWRELKRWGIDLQRLPAGSRIEFREANVWGTYRGHILGAIGLICLQVLFIAWLLMNRNIRKRAEVRLRESEKEAKRLAQENELIAEVGRIISSTLNLEEVYEHFAEKVRRAISFDRIAVNIVNTKDYTRTVRHLKGHRFAGNRVGEALPLAGTGVEQALRKKSSLLINGNKREEMRKKFPGLSSFSTSAQTTMIIPLVSNDEVIGTLSFHSDKIDAYSENDLLFAERIGSQIAGAIANAQLFLERNQAEKKLQDTLDSLRKALNTTIQVMVSVVEAKDPYTAGHQVWSADIARAIATEMGLPQEKIDAIRIAGSIHDIGKISIPAEILSKPTKLSDVEFSLIKEHAHIGFKMLKDVESPWPLAEIIYQHHERMDGSGYPRNLKGDDILMEARILAVADVVEAMASHRPYRPGLGLDAALEEIERNRGTLYDKTATDACLRLFREKGFKLKGICL